MKKILVALLLFCSILIMAYSQERTALPGFWGIDWQESKDEVKAALIAKGCVIEQEIPDVIMATGTFTGEQTTILAQFVNDKFFSATVFYEYKDNQAIKKYQSIVSMLKEKYGEPDKSVMNFQKPYFYGDGYEETALKVNKAILFSMWEFDDKNTIKCAIGYQLSTAIIYSNTILDQESTELEKAKNSKDL